MGLNVSFDCRGYNEDKLPNLDFGVHLILSDGCIINLEDKTENLSEAQKQALEVVKRDDRKKRFLLYRNTKFVDRLFDSQGIFTVYCPTCDNEYSLTRQEYEEAYAKFARGEL